MPEEEKRKGPGDIPVDLDTSGPEVDVTIEEVKQDDGKLEEYSKGVQSRIAKLTRKMREAERREQAAIEYARSVEEKRRNKRKNSETYGLENNGLTI